MITETNFEKKYDSWIYSDLNYVIYTYFSIFTLILILKYLMVAIKIPQKEIYKLIILVFIYFLLTLIIIEDISET